MQAVKALYKNGNIELLSPITGVDEAELFVVVLDSDEQIPTSSIKFIQKDNSSESEFKDIGLTNFFDTEEDNDVDWENYFNAPSR